jgi:hypothetical protein
MANCDECITGADQHGAVRADGCFQAVGAFGQSFTYLKEQVVIAVNSTSVDLGLARWDELMSGLMRKGCQNNELTSEALVPLSAQLQ